MLLHKELTEQIIGGAYKVHGRLGSGFLEKVYENALTVELGKRGLAVAQQQPIKVYYEGVVVGEYFADLLIEGKVVCELKTAECLSRHHEIQLVNYLKATGIDTGLLINFADKVTVRRKFRRSGGL